ncbi:hypothetical protein MPTK2_1g03730 [Marchantia polymorpha subsp. ruderalis]
MGAFRRTWLIAFLFIRLSTELVPVVSAHTRKLDNSSSLFSVYPTPCFPGTFIFGDSLVDNGNAMAVYPDRFARLEQDPFGVSWPGHGADRFCDGKLIGDYLSWGTGGFPMSAYLRSVQTLLFLGVNLAASGSTVLPGLTLNPIFQDDEVFPHTPFTLDQQLQWYKHFMFRDSELSKGRSMQNVIPVGSFNSSLHLIIAGYTDYILQFLSGWPEALVLASVTGIVNGISDTAEMLHTTHKVKDIVVVNLPPLGCTPAFLTIFPGDPDDYDDYGCLTSFNAAIELHNEELFRAVLTLRAKYPDLSLSYGNFYRTFQDILKHPSKFGFHSTPKLLKACCGAGGKYNFEPNVTCGASVFANGKLHNGTVCKEPTKHLFWDGFHPSGAVNRIAAISFLNGTALYPSDGLRPPNCKPDFSQF